MKTGHVAGRGASRPEARRHQGRRARRSGIPGRRCSRPKWARTAIPSPPRPAPIIAVKVNGVTPPKLKPLDQVRAQALAAWTQEQQRQAAGHARPRALTAQAQKEKSLDGIAKALKRQRAAQPGAEPRSTNDTMFAGHAGAAAVRRHARRAWCRARRARPATSSSPGVTGITHPRLDPARSRLPAAARRSCRRHGGGRLLHRPGQCGARPPGREGQPEAGGCR